MNYIILLNNMIGVLLDEHYKLFGVGLLKVVFIIIVSCLLKGYRN